MKRKKKFLGIFDRRPLIWFHYLLLSAAVFLVHWISDITKLEMWAITNGGLGYFVLFLYYAIFLGILDQIIHWIIRVD